MAIFICCYESCNQPNSDYVKNLEEQNKRLEQELDSQKNNQITPDSFPTNTNNNSQNSTGYFTIGSSEEDVLQVMGDPNSIMNYDALNMKCFYYGRSSVTFKNGKVTEYSNSDNNLKVKYKASNSSDNESHIVDGIKSPNNTTKTIEKKTTKWVYFSGFAGGTHYYSRIYEIDDYTEDKALQIKNALIDKLKLYTNSEEKVVLLIDSFSSYASASKSWEGEMEVIKGKRIPDDDFF